MKNLCSIRGAITVKKNSPGEIKKATIHLLKEIIKANKLKESEIINLIFTATYDLNAVNPATIARQELNLNSTPVLCVQEMKIKNGLKKCIRVLVQAQTSLTKNKARHIYLGQASKLRPDLN